MTDKIPANKDRETIMSFFHQDGILDVIIGAVLLNLSLDLLNQGSSISLFTWIPLLIYASTKKRVTMPRIGYESVHADERMVGNWNAYTAVGVAIGMFLLSTMVFNDPLGLQKLALPFSGDMRALVTGVMLSLSCLAGALILPLKRFYIYGAVALVSGIVGCFAHSTNIAALIPSAAFLGFGIRLMTRFMRAYPLEEEQPKVKEKKAKKEKKINEK